MSEINFCQSCGMPLENSSMKGTELDGSKSEEYCEYCYKDGKFTQDISIDEMIEINLQHIDEWNKNIEQPMSVNEAKAQLQLFIPNLKRWKK